MTTDETKFMPYGMNLNNYRLVKVGTVRDVLLDVIDGGCTCGSGEHHPWEFDHAADEDIANMQRLRLVDEVAHRLALITTAT